MTLHPLVEFDWTTLFIPLNAEVKNGQSYISLLLYTFMVMTGTTLPLLLYNIAFTALLTKQVNFSSQLFVFTFRPWQCSFRLDSVNNTEWRILFGKNMLTL
jgi:hypothetical protein